MCVYVSRGGSIRSVTVNYFTIKMGTCHFNVLYILYVDTYKGVWNIRVYETLFKDMERKAITCWAVCLYNSSCAISLLTETTTHVYRVLSPLHGCICVWLHSYVALLEYSVCSCMLAVLLEGEVWARVYTLCGCMYVEVCGRSLNQCVWLF